MGKEAGIDNLVTILKQEEATIAFYYYFREIQSIRV